MRILALAMLVIGTVSIGPAAAQTYDPAYPVCLHVYGPITYYECRYTSLPQCNVSASGRAAQCVINPIFCQCATARRTTLSPRVLIPTAAAFDSFWDSQIGETLTRCLFTKEEQHRWVGRLRSHGLI
jgi:hypothetical protein